MTENGTIRVLLLEDDDDLREMIAAVLRKDGFDVTEAMRGEQALHLACESPHDLIITDLNTPGMGGLETLARIKERAPATRAMVITGYSTEADSIQAISLGVGSYLKKPFSLEKLRAAVESLVREIQAERKLLVREEAVSRATLWALETLARSVDLEQNEPRLGWFEAARLTRRLALCLGQSRGPAEDAQLAVLALGVAQREDAEDFLPLLNDSVVWLKGKLEESTQPQLENLSLALASLGRELARAEPSKPLLEQMGQAYPEELRQALRTVTSEAAPSRPFGEGRRRQALLSLAETLEGSQDSQGAGEIYQELNQESPHTREGVQACLGLARLARLQGDVPRARETARESVNRAHRLGPSSAALTTLDAGILLAELGDTEAIEILGKVIGWLEELQLPASAARARLALAAIGMAPTGALGDSLEILCQPQHIQQMLASARWLLPFLLKKQADLPQPAGGQLLNRLVRNAPRELERLLEQKGLLPGAQREALKALERVGVEFHRGSLERLAASADAEIREQAATLSSSGTGQIPILRIYSLGQFQVFQGERAIKGKTWTKKVRHLMAFLASRGHRAVSEDTLLEEFWPRNPEQGRKSLWQVTSRLRSLLKPPEVEGELNYILRSGNSLKLNTELPIWHDYDELAKIAEQLGNPNPDVTALAHSLAELDRGVYLDGCMMDWALRIRDRVENIIRAAAKKLGEVALQQQRYEQAMECGHRLLEADLCSQAGHLILVEALIGLGQPKEALQQYQRAEKTLREQLGEEPTIDLFRAFQKAKLLL